MAMSISDGYNHSEFDKYEYGYDLHTDLLPHRTVPNEGLRARLPGYYMQNILSYYYIILLGLSQWPSGIRYASFCLQSGLIFIFAYEVLGVYSTVILFQYVSLTAERRHHVVCSHL
jgi:hypothetical protein